MAKLTAKQENFCLVYLETGSASEAYRRAYSTDRMKPETINRNAHQLLKNNKIATRIKELQEKVAKKAEITVETLLEELEEARTAGLKAETPQASAAVGATMAKAKLLGLDKQIIELSGKHGRPIQVESIPTDPVETAKIYQEIMGGNGD